MYSNVNVTYKFGCYGNLSSMTQNSELKELETLPRL